MDDERLGQLTQLGLNSYEAKAYLALLGRDSFSATQVSDLSGVPRQRIYDILASLVERGLAISRPGKKGLKYSAVAPSVALRALVEREQQRLAQLESSAQALAAALTERYQAGKEESSPLDYIEVLRGPNAISQRFAEIQANCQHEILIFTKPPYASPPAENEAGLEALHRHVEARSLYEYDALRDPATRQAIAHFIRQGEAARFVGALPLKLVIVDEEIVMFAMEDPIVGRTELTIMVVENHELAEVMKVAFEALWEQGEPFEEACQRLNLPIPTPALP